MKSRNDIQRISSSLNALGMQRMDELMKENIGYLKPNEDVTAAIADAFAMYAVEEKERKAELLLKRSRIPEPAYFSDFWDYGVRVVDRELLKDATELHFIDEHRNSVIWGGSGTGKSWVARVIATNSCKALHRTLWVDFPCLIRDLRRKRAMEGMAFDSRLKYYSKFDLLCIDEFMNIDIGEGLSSNDIFLFQELVNRLYNMKKSIMVIGQCDPFKLDSFIKPRSVAQSLQGRLLGHSTVISMAGPDLRMYDSLNEDIQTEN